MVDHFDKELPLGHLECAWNYREEAGTNLQGEMWLLFHSESDCSLLR